MTSFPGIVTLDDHRVPVVVGLGAGRVTLLSGEVEIGEWPTTECLIVDGGDGTWRIEAENDSVRFHPDDPGGFARGLRSDLVVDTGGSGDPSIDLRNPRRLNTMDVADGPPPRPVTRLGFYALATLTAALGLWALITLLV